MDFIISFRVHKSIILIALFFNYCIASLEDSNKFTTFPDLMDNYGYKIEIHNVATQDGYILTVHRAVYPNLNSSTNLKEYPVLFLHGFLASSDCFVLRGPDEDLALKMINLGFDVWFLNFRGNFYSRHHQTLSPDSHAKFWRFSVHEMAVYDLPATIDYVLEKTGEKKLSILGYSLGSVITCMLLSTKIEYNEKIALNIFLAPTVFFKNVLRSPFHLTVGASFKYILELFYSLGINEVFPRNRIYSEMDELFCLIVGSDDECFKLGLSILGVARSLPTTFDRYSSRKIYHHLPAGTSLRVIDHVYQSVIGGKLRFFDFGWRNNLKIYNNSQPPEYSYEKISSPCYIYYSPNDGIATVESVKELLKILPNVQGFMIQDKYFHHFDYLLHKNAKTLLYDDILNVIRKKT